LGNGGVAFPADLRPTGYPIHPIGYPIQQNPTYLQPTEYSNQAPGYPIQPNPTYFQPSEYHNARPAVQIVPTYSHQAGSGVQSLPTYFQQAGPGVRIVPTYSGLIRREPATSSEHMISDVRSIPVNFNPAGPGVRIVPINYGLIRRGQDVQSPPTSLDSESSSNMNFTSDEPRYYDYRNSTAYAPPMLDSFYSPSSRINKTTPVLSRHDIGTQTEYVVHNEEYSQPRTTSPLPTATHALAKLSVIIDSSEQNTGMLALMQRREEIGSPSPNPRTFPFPPNQPRVLPVTRPLNLLF